MDRRRDEYTARMLGVDSIIVSPKLPASGGMGERGNILSRTLVNSLKKDLAPGVEIRQVEPVDGRVERSVRPNVGGRHSLRCRLVISVLCHPPPQGLWAEWLRMKIMALAAVHGINDFTHRLTIGKLCGNPATAPPA